MFHWMKWLKLYWIEYTKKRSCNWYNKKLNERAFKPMYKKRWLCIPWQHLCLEWRWQCSALGLILANIFMVELERLVIPNPMDQMKCWTRYVNDVLCFIKTDSMDYALKMLNGFHRNIQFTYEVETHSQNSFLDILVIRDSSNNINMTVHQKSTNKDIYLN